MSSTPSSAPRPDPVPLTRRLRGLLRRAASAVALLVLGAVLWTVGPDRRGPAGADPDATWGQEALQSTSDAATESLADWLPMAPANACGLGASSCFKCHNGKRAGAPKSDPGSAPWHAQHAKVNNSCVGCHRGNPRVMKDDVAHAKMIAKPRDDAAGTCAGCHTADLAKVKTAYMGGK